MRHHGFALVAAGLLAATAAHAQSPAGLWAGIVTEKNVGQYVVVVEIDPNERTGEVHFLRYPCGGPLSRIGKDGATFTYQEKLTYGTARCVPNLQARVTVRGPDAVLFEEMARGQANVSGELTRVQPVQR